MSKVSIYEHYEPYITPPADYNNDCYWFVFYTNKMLVNIEDGNYRIPLMKSLEQLNLKAIRTQYLGILNGLPCFSAETHNDNTPDGMSYVDLAALYGEIDEDLFYLAGKATQIVSWDQTNQFCGRCGTRMNEMPGERAKKCPECGFISYPRICPAVITAIFKDNKILMAHANGFKEGMYGLIAGFLEPGETLEEGVKREIMEEVSLKVKNIKYFGSQPWPFPNSMMIGFTAEYESGEITVDGQEIETAEWFSIDNLPMLPPKLSIARKIIDWYIDKNK